MDKKIKPILFIFICLIVFIITAYGAETKAQSVTLDGNFDDWDSIGPLVSNSSSVSGNNAELKTLKAYVEEGYIFLYVERWNSTLSHYWDLDVMFFGNKVTKDDKRFQYPPWENKHVNVPTLDVFMARDYQTGEYKADVSFADYYSATYSVSPDFTKVEFAIPLSALEISPQLTDVVFSVNSVTNRVARREWIDNAGPIVLAGVPIFGDLEPFIILLLICLVGYTAYKKQKESNSRQGIGLNTIQIGTINQTKEERDNEILL